MSDMSNIVLFSGGVDSLTTALMLKNKNIEYDGLYLDLGNKYAQIERHVAENLACEIGFKLHVVELAGIGQFEKEDAEIPFRNDLLCLVAMMFDARDIYVSVEFGTFDNKSKDRSDKFRKKISEYLSWRVSDHVVVRNIVKDLTKQDEIRWVIDIIGDWGSEIILRKAFSCYNPQIVVKENMKWAMCGNCPACIRLYLAMAGNGLFRNDWAKDPSEGKMYRQYMDAVFLEGKYSGRRGEQYREAFQKIEVSKGRGLYGIRN